MAQRVTVASLKNLKTIAVVGFTIAVVLCLVGWWQWSDSAPGSKESLATAREALRQNDFERARQATDRIPRDSAEWLQARLIAAEAAMRSGSPDAALTILAAIPRDGSPQSAVAAFTESELLRDAGRLRRALEACEYAAEIVPADVRFQSRLAFLYGLTGQRWESVSPLLSLVRSGQAQLQELAILGDTERALEYRDYLELCLQKSPGDPLTQLGLGAACAAEGSPSQARQYLEAARDGAPAIVAAHTLLGELLVDQPEASIADWFDQLPAGADDDPSVWLVRGLWARKLGELPVAARCFREVLLRHPEHRRANYQQGLVLHALGRSESSEFSARAGDFFELTQRLDEVLRSEGRNEPATQRVIALMEKTGRYWEAWAWCRQAIDLYPRSAWPRQKIEQLTRLAADASDRTALDHQPAVALDVSMYPVWQTLLDLKHRTQPELVPDDNASGIRFHDATSVMPAFAYDNGADSSSAGARMFEQTGGGVAVLDFDHDGWPDIYFTQGGDFINPSVSEFRTRSDEAADRLIRNHGGQRFEDTSTRARLIDGGFGQGVTVGDFDNDGFTDLYVANIGRNQLHLNNGDGTFTESTQVAGLNATGWTTSCLLADLNADGIADLFDVNYVTGSDVYELICNGHACSPKVFDGVPDQVYLGQGDGTVRNVSGATPESNAKGLGIVAASLSSPGRLDLFIANDQVPNFFLQNTTDSQEGAIRFDNSSFLTGLAYNHDGLAMACMGIAADDVNGDGRVDFFVTNFKDEFNTLYLQDSSGLFSDATSRTGLAPAGFPYVGWGTQFLDANLDGRPDLIVVNGHVDDYRDEGGEYQMPSHFFQQTANEQFRLLSPDEAGEWFSRKRLGRGLARLDWNRDGRPEFVVSCIGERASLLTNVTASTGHFLKVQLVATRSARDAIGTQVAVVAGESRWMKQLTAGDGYQATNERVLQFGLANWSGDLQLMIDWPSGSQQTIDHLPVDCTLKIVEGSDDATIWVGTPGEATHFVSQKLSTRSDGSDVP